MSCSAGSVPVVHVLSWLPVGGVERQLIEVLTRFDRDRYAPQICCIRERGELADEAEARGLPVFVVPQRARFHPITLPRLARHFSRARAAVMHAHMYRAGATGSVAAWLARVPVRVCTVHTVRGWDSPHQVRTERRLQRLKDAFIAVSDAVRADFVERVGISESRVEVIRNGIDSKDLRARAELARSTATAAATVRNRLGLPSDRAIIGAIGRLVPDKAHDVLLRAFALLAGRFPDVDVAIAGEGPLRPELTALARELGLERRIHLLGTVTEIPEFLGQLAFVAQPSRREGFSLGIIEALATGNPVVTTDVGGNREAVQHGYTGLLVPPDDAEALADALTRLLGDEALRRRMGAAAASTGEHFDIAHTVDALQSLYDRLLATRAPNAPRLRQP
ncbi:MAG: glycosyltransferase [Candidatus Schekmanbacteria bacterium]|nr:glycosyltransferase [Candidatus Schekmanbacteria bacterium]